MRTILKAIIVMKAAILLFTACTPPENKREGIYIVCTTGMLQDALQQLVGDMAHVEALMGPGVDPHLYKASQGDLKKLQQADIIVYNGLHLEGKMAEILERMQKQKHVIAAAELLPKEYIRLTDDGVYDPHIWFDVSLWASMTKLLYLELLNTGWFDSEVLQANSDRLKKELDALHTWVETQITSIPTEQRVLVTAHDAFQYFGLAYQIEVRGLQGLSTLSEFGLRDISDLVKFLSERNIPAVFVESSVSDKALRAVIEGSEKQGHKVLIGGNLFSDAMGEAGTAAGTYKGMVEHNIRAITQSLGAEK